MRKRDEESNPTYNGIKKNKTLGINLTKEVKKKKNLYLENYKILMKEIEEDTIHGVIYCAHGLEELLLLK